MNNKDKTGLFVDKRFGEYDSTMTAEERMLQRFQHERMKRHERSGAFNLPDPEDSLTHGGQVGCQVLLRCDVAVFVNVFLSCVCVGAGVWVCTTLLVPAMKQLQNTHMLDVLFVCSPSDKCWMTTSQVMTKMRTTKGTCNVDMCCVDCSCILVPFVGFTVP